MSPDPRYEQDETDAAAAEAARIGGVAGDEDLDPALRPVIEGGGGEAEGFEERAHVRAAPATAWAGGPTATARAAASRTPG